MVAESVSVRASIGRCFALSTRVELVRHTLGMEPVGGLREGHVTAHSRVVWRGWKFGLPTEHHTLITGFKPPCLDENGQGTACFEDSQEHGRFASFQHGHFFRESRDPEGRPATHLHDEVRFSLPFGLIGRLIAKAVLAPYIHKLARERFAMIKGLAEGEGWRDWMTEE